MVKYKIDDLYRAKITKMETPDYTSNSFVTSSNHEFIFERKNETYKEVFTGIEFDTTVKDVSLASHSRTLISPTPLRASYFKKEQREKGEVGVIHIIPVYNKLNEPRKKLVKTRAA